MADSKYSLLRGYEFCDQTTLDVAQTVRMTVRAPHVANRIFQTLAQAQAYVNIYDDTATAVRGLVLSVYDDDISADNNGLYLVKKVKTNASDSDGILQPICRNDCCLPTIVIADYNTDLDDYHNDDIYFCILSGSPEVATTTYIFVVDNMENQLLWYNKGYGTRWYNSVDGVWSAWKWVTYLDSTHKHVSADIIDSLSSLPYQIGDEEKLVQAQAIQSYLDGIGAQEVPTVDHMLIYCEDNKTLIAKEFMLPYVYVVDNMEDELACLSPAGVRTDTDRILKEWRAYSNSQNMPEFGGGVSWDADAYTPVGYCQGYGNWTVESRTKALMSGGQMVETNGYMSPSPFAELKLEAYVGCSDNTSSNIQNDHSRGIWVLNMKDATPASVSDGTITYYRNTMYDMENKTVSSPWKAWASLPDASGITRVIYGGQSSTYRVNEHGTYGPITAISNAFYQDAFPSGNTYLLFSGSSYEDRHTPISAITETAINTSFNMGASGTISAIEVDIDNFAISRNSKTITVKSHVFDLDSKFVGRIYCDAEDNRGSQTVVSTDDENEDMSFAHTIINETEGKTVVPFNVDAFTNGQTSLVKSLVEYKNGVLKLSFSDVQTDLTANLIPQLNNSSNVEYNGASITIDFNTESVRIVDTDGNITTKALPADGSLWNDFKTGEEVNVMYENRGCKTSVFKSTNSSIPHNIILNVNETSPHITWFNEETWMYETVVTPRPIDYMHGSHMAYNDITGTLWYSNGTEIFPIVIMPKHHTHVSADIIDSVSAITDENSASTCLVETRAVYNYIDNTIPKEYHELIYTEDVVHEIPGGGQVTKKELVPRGFMYDGGIYANNEKIYVVNTKKDLDDCKGEQVDEPDILQEWRQFSYSQYSPEYNTGKKPLDTGSDGFGYGRWGGVAGHPGIITNPVNSYDYMGYIDESRVKNLSVESVIGCSYAQTTGDLLGCALINTDNAQPRRVVTTGGDTYNRDTLYDITSGYTASANTGTYEAAWVCEKNGIAYVVYSKGGQGYPTETWPDSSATIYRAAGTQDSTKRKSVSPTENTLGTRTEVNPSGYITTLNIMTVNSTDISWGSIGSGYGSTGTVYVFTQVYSLDSRDGTYYDMNLNTYYPFSKNQTRAIINGNAGRTGSDSGAIMVPYVSNLDQATKGTRYSFIKSNVVFDGDVLQVAFSDVTSGKTSGGTLESYDSFLDKHSNSTDMPYNGSVLTINLPERKYTLIGRKNDDNTQEKYEDVALGNMDVNVYNPSTNSYDTINVLDTFSGNTKIMYFAQSEAYLAIKSSAVKFQDRLIIDLGNEEESRPYAVWRYNPSTKTYDNITESDNVQPLDVFLGSHMAYNDVTGILWYSNGSEIYPLTQKMTIGMSGYTATDVGVLDGNSLIKESDTLSEILQRILFKTFEAELISTPKIQLSTAAGASAFDTYEAYSTVNTTLAIAYTDAKFKSYINASTHTTIDGGCPRKNTTFTYGSNTNTTSGTTAAVNITLGDHATTVLCSAQTKYGASTVYPHNSDGQQNTGITVASGSCSDSSANYAFKASYKYFIGYKSDADFAGATDWSAFVRGLNVHTGFVTQNKGDFEGGKLLTTKDAIYTADKYWLVIAFPYNGSYKFKPRVWADLGTEYSEVRNFGDKSVKLGDGTTTATYRIYRIAINNAKYKNITIQAD